MLLWPRVIPCPRPRAFSLWSQIDDWSGVKPSNFNKNFQGPQCCRAAKTSFGVSLRLSESLDSCESMNSSVDEILNSYSLWEYEFKCHSDSNRTAQQLQMAALKSLETMSCMILNRLQPKFAQRCSQISRKSNAMFESHVVREVLVTSVDRTSFDFQFEDFLSNLPL